MYSISLLFLQFALNPLSRKGGREVWKESYFLNSSRYVGAILFPLIQPYLYAVYKLNRVEIWKWLPIVLSYIYCKTKKNFSNSFECYRCLKISNRLLVYKSDQAIPDTKEKRLTSHKPEILEFKQNFVFPTKTTLKICRLINRWHVFQKNKFQNASVILLNILEKMTLDV